MAVGIYATKDAMLARFGNSELVQASNLDLPVGPDPMAIDDNVLNAVMSEANSMVDGYIQAKYRLPLNPVPPSLTAKACDIARFTLWKSRASERVLEGYNNAIAFLKDIARGLVALGPTATTEAPTVAIGAKSYVDPDEPEMSTGNMNDYRFPSGGLC